MKQVIEKFFCDLCGKEVSEDKDLDQLRLAGHGVATSTHEICWDCITSFAEWKSSRIGKGQTK